ncbi:MAG: sulfotransferase domain-containing protein [Chloroflexota bacterium]
MESVNDRKFVIIGGATKSGTTSFYRYLEKHEDICCSTLKETRFFLDKTYPLPVQSYYEDTGLDPYLDYFQWDRKFYLEATPDYLFSPGTPSRVKEALGLDNVQWIFILRDPIERLKSWYQFGKQVGQIDPNLKIEDYIETQLEGSAARNIQAFRALEQGNYSNYLSPFIDIFGKNRVLVLSFDQLKEHSEDLMKDICSFLKISFDNFQEKNFTQHNVSISVKNNRLQSFYHGLSKFLYMRVYNKPLIRKGLHQIRKVIIEPIYRNVNISQQKETVTIPARLREALEEYYRDYYHPKEG